MASERAIEIRDRLNKIVDELTDDTNDPEDNVLACCVSVAVEEVEKWMYKGAFTPSVQPFRANKNWQMPCNPGEENDDQFTGPPWARTKKNIFDDMPTLKKIKARAAAQNRPVMVRKTSFLDKLEIDEWSLDVMRSFKEGNGMCFMAGIREMYPLVKISLNELTDYLARVRREHPHLWNNGKWSNV